MTSLADLRSYREILRTAEVSLRRLKDTHAPPAELKTWCTEQRPGLIRSLDGIKGSLIASNSMNRIGVYKRNKEKLIRALGNLGITATNPIATCRPTSEPLIAAIAEMRSLIELHALALFPDEDIETQPLTVPSGTNATPSQHKMFIVHGHSDVDMLALKNYLQNTLRLGEPIVLRERPNQGKTIIEKFEEESKDVELVFVLLTPDDKVLTADNYAASNEEKRRARQNVIFELGFFYGILERVSGRVILLHRGETELPSDISGVLLIDISHGITAAGEVIRRELRNMKILPQ